MLVTASGQPHDIEAKFFLFIADQTVGVPRLGTILHSLSFLIFSPLRPHSYIT